MTTEQIKLIEDNQKLVYFVVNKYFKYLPRDIKEELVLEGFLSLTQKVKSYAPSKGNFSTFMAKCIYHDLILFLRREKDLNTLALDDNVTDNLTYMDTLAYEQKELNYIDLYTSLNKLPSKKKDIITKIYLQGKTQVEVAKEYNVSTQRISFLVIQTLLELRNNLEYNIEIKQDKPPIKELAKELNISERTYYRRMAKKEKLNEHIFSRS